MNLTPPLQMQPAKILISVGEASGDLHASNLIRAVLAQNSAVKFFGMGGNLMRAAGATILVDTSKIALIGALKIITNCFAIFRALRVMKAFLKNEHPQILILVDYAEFNFRLAKYAKKLGIKVIYYISPKLWAWRQHRVKLVKKYVDVMAVIFPFEVDFYKKWDIPAIFVGNPLLPIVKTTKPIITTKIEHNLDLTAKTIGLLPGSRHGEIERLLPVMLKTAEKLQQDFPAVQFILPVAPSLAEADLAPYLTKSQLKIHLIKNDTYNVVSCCDAVIVASGTATLETALLAIPMVIIYKVSELEYWIGKKLIKLKYIGLCNILANEAIVPELIQQNASAENIANEIKRILTDLPYRNLMLAKLKQIKQHLNTDTQTNLATIICQHISSNSR